MEKGSTYVGLGVHKKAIAVGVAEGHGGEVRSLGLIPNRPEAVRKQVRRLGPAERLVCAYEAGPCEYVLYRYLTWLGMRCVVVAPFLIPTKPGDRLSKFLLRLGLLPPAGVKPWGVTSTASGSRASSSRGRASRLSCAIPSGRWSKRRIGSVGWRRSWRKRRGRAGTRW
jgi:transposase